MLLSYDSDIFSILRLDIIILRGKMDIIRWLYCSTLSNSCILNTKKKKKTTMKIRGSPAFCWVKKKTIPPWLSSCAQVLSWPHFCDLNHVISMALDKSHERYFIPINNLKSCVAGVTAVSSVWAAVTPKSHSCLGIHSQESWRRGVYGQCEKSW